MIQLAMLVSGCMIAGMKIIKMHQMTALSGLMVIVLSVSQEVVRLRHLNDLLEIQKENNLKLVKNLVKSVYELLENYLKNCG